MGTPEFAVASLEILVENNINVVGVITAPDKPRGRGKVTQGTPVKEYAVSKGLNVLQPTNLKSEAFINELSELKADLQVVVAFRMLPEVVWDMPPLGTFNLHASLLPQYRGAAPINWAIINGETETGVTTFFLQHEIDTGNIILQEKEPIGPTDTVGDLYGRLMIRGAQLVLTTIRKIESKNYVLSEQVESGDLKSAPKIFKETCEIDWGKPASEIFNFVRGLSPYPSAWTILNNKKYKLYKTSIDETSNLGSGEIESDGKHYVKIGTGTKAISLVELQPDGKKRMNIADFLRGNQI